MKFYFKIPCLLTLKPWFRDKIIRNVYKLLKKVRRLCEVNNNHSLTCIFTLVTMAIVTVIILLCLFLGIDRCNGHRLKQSLCTDYNEGLITGELCYSICIEESVPLMDCYKESKHDITYRYEDSLIKLQRYAPAETLPYPISYETFQNKLSTYLMENLGHADAVLEKLLQFADLNYNGELDFAESNSLWQLLHVRQFFILLIFQEESTFPQINGTCGSAFAYDYISSTPLYQKKDGNSFIQYFFPNYNHWLLPSWETRANIAVGLLELTSTLTESFSSKFFMCEIKPTNFGVSFDYEAKVVEFDSLITERQLLQNSANKHCFFDSECYYGNGCSMICDVNSRTCSTIPRRPIVSVVCDILKDYILYDSPDDFKFRFESLISQCQSLTFSNHTIPQNVIPAKIKELLWNQVKNKPVDWLNPKKVKKKEHS